VQLSVVVVLVGDLGGHHDLIFGGHRVGVVAAKDVLFQVISASVSSDAWAERRPDGRQLRGAAVAMRAHR